MDKKISIIVQAIVAAARRNLQGLNKDLNDLGQGSIKLGQQLRAQGASVEDAGAALGQLGYSADEVKETLRAAGYETDELASSFDVMGTAASAARDAVIFLAAGFAALKLGEKVFDMLETAAAAERVAEGFDTLAARSQVDSEILLSALKEASRGTISEYDLMLQANKAWYLGVAKNVREYADLMKIAEVKSKDLGMSTVQYWERLTSAIASGYPITLRQLGVVIDNERAYEDYAASIGVAADELTDQEQVQARVNAVLAEGESTLRRWETAERDAMTVTQDFRAAVADLTLEIEKKLLPVLIPALDWITKGLRGVEAGMEGQRAEIGRLVEQTGSAAEAEKAFADNIVIASQGLIDQTEAARLASVAILDYKMDLIGIDKGIQYDIRAMEMAEQAQKDWSGTMERGARDAERLADAIEKAGDIHAKYARDVEEANYRFGRSVADATFRATQAAEDAAFRRYEIERDSSQRIDDLYRRAEQDRGDYVRQFHMRRRFDLADHLNELKRLQEDHYDELADMEWDYQEDRQDLLKRSPWWIRQALQAEFTERERIAATGDAKALRDYDRALREKIRAIDPIYAKELDELQKQYDHKAEIEDREADQARDRTTEDWELSLREQKANLEEQLRQLERNLQEQTRIAERELRDQLEAWDFHARQRRENEARAMENLIADHAHKLDILYQNTNRQLAELDPVYKRWGQQHGESYIDALQTHLNVPVSVPTPGGIDEWTPSGGPPWAEWQRGAWEIPRDMWGRVHKGEMVVPTGPAEALREGLGGVTVIIENLHLGGGGSLMDARLFGDELGEYLGRRIQQQGR